MDQNLEKRDFLSRTIALVSSRIEHLNAKRSVANPVAQDEIEILINEGRSLIEKIEALKASQDKAPSFLFSKKEDQRLFDALIYESKRMCEMQDEIFNIFNSWIQKQKAFTSQANIAA